MENSTKTGSPVAAPSLVEFEPHCEWKKEEGVTTLILDLPKFKKEQLRVQVNNQGLLKVTGERPTAEDRTNKTRFSKETKIPQGCDINDIRAKFTDGRLHIRFPIKLVSDLENQKKNEKPASVASASQQQPPPKSEELPKPKSENADIIGEGPTVASPEKGMASSIFRLQDRKQVALAAAFGVAAVIMVGIGAYMGNKCVSWPSSLIDEAALYY